MAHLFDNYVVTEEKIDIEGIPCIRLIPKGKKGKLPTVIFYHGLDSNKERQRMRSYMIAFSGYQVFIPDSVHHGERNAKQTEDVELIAKYFWDAILTSVEESDKLIDKIIAEYNADENKIFVTGHSMGGFISAGILTHNDKIKGAAPLNGSFNWTGSNQVFLESIEGFDENLAKKIKEQVDRIDPMNHVDKLENKDLLIIHGEEDTEVNIDPQREFYNEVKNSAEEKIDIKMIEYEGLGHFVTTGMIEEVVKWIKERE